MPSEGSPLRAAPVLKSVDGVLHGTLRLGPVRLVGWNLSVTTRAFNGAVPGPTLAVRPGDRMVIELENDLGEPVGPDAANSFHHPNFTNLHVHGLHVSPLRPGDDVLYNIVRPGRRARYQYEVPVDHSPGTYWAHPHYHGSAVLQTGAGAACALLVLDPVGFLSEQLAALPEHTLVLQNLPRPMLVKAAVASHDELFRIERWPWSEDVWLVNGAPRPVLEVRQHEWQRLRLVAVGVSTYLNLTFGGCEVALLAKDGVYITDFPRMVSQVFLPPGGRADVVVRCPGSAHGQGGDHVASSMPPEGAKPARAFDGALFTLRSLSTVPSKGLAFQDLLPWAPASRPAYLQDLQSISAPTCACTTAMGGNNSKWINGHLFEGRARYLHRSPKDAVIQRRLFGVDAHPYHQHTYPFQLMATPAGNNAYFKAGDWHDTYLNVNDGAMTMRFHTVDFAGPQVVHCHNLAHSDGGMIAVEWVGGSGRAECGCDLLNLDGPAGVPGSLGMQSRSLLQTASLAFICMLAIAAIAAFKLSREWPTAVAASSYNQLPSGPIEA